MFPKDGIRQSDIDEYNAQMRYELEHIRDFIVLHYHVQQRTDSPMWQAMREMPVPASLQHRLDLFRETGRVFRVPNEAVHRELVGAGDARPGAGAGAASSVGRT